VRGPLAAEEVAKFWSSFRTFRDLALVGLRLLDGLRYCKVLNLQLQDLQLADAQMRVLGKGNKQRVLPLPGEIIQVLQDYFRLERPLTASPYLFLSLKGPPAWQAHDPGRTPLAVPSPSLAEPPGPARQSASLSPLLRRRYGLCRYFLARPATAHGPFPDSNHWRKNLNAHS
jgi:Phage integrase family